MAFWPIHTNGCKARFLGFGAALSERADYIRIRLRFWPVSARLRWSKTKNAPAKDTAETFCLCGIHIKNITYQSENQGERLTRHTQKKPLR